jgi:hypothetical protein
MAVADLAKRYYYDNNGNSTNYTTIIVIVVIILVLKICLIAWICYYRNKKRKERRAKGCQCYSDADYYCLPWWYWSSDRRCHCGALNNSIYNAPPEQSGQPPAYTSPPVHIYNVNQGSNSALGYNAMPYRSGPDTETGQWNSQQESVPLKPPQQAQVNGQYY